MSPSDGPFDPDALARCVHRLTDDPRPLSAEAVAAGLSRLQEMFSEHLGALATERLQVPGSFLAYLRLAGGGQHGESVTFWTWDSMLQSTASWTSLYADYQPEPEWEERPATGPWLHVASFGDKHWLFLCCDRAHPEHGHVAEGYDLVPWMDEDELDFNMGSVLDPWGDDSPDDARWTFEELLLLLAEHASANAP